MVCVDQHPNSYFTYHDTRIEAEKYCFLVTPWVTYSALICARFWGIHHWGVHSNSPIHIVPFIRVTKWMLRCNAVQGDCGTSTILPHKAWALMKDEKAAYRDWVACIKLTREYRSKCHIRRASTLCISFVYTYIAIYKQFQSRKPIGEQNSHIPPLNYDSPLPGYLPVQLQTLTHPNWEAPWSLLECERLHDTSPPQILVLKQDLKLYNVHHYIIVWVCKSVLTYVPTAILDTW